jgi:hypothetical protein
MSGVAFDYSERNDAPTGSPERQLWCAVIERALHDALDSVSTISHPPQRQQIREDARRWFVHDDPDFRNAAESAGYDPHTLRHRVLRIIGEPQV